MSVIITLDGPSASGKGTLASKIANTYGFYHIDTGVFYRAIAQKSLTQPQDSSVWIQISQNLKSLVEGLDLQSPTLRTEAVAQQASKISKIPEIRSAVTDFIRQHARAQLMIYPGIVADGRDVGTHIFPDASVKFYLNVTPEERARRRHQEYQERKQAHTLEEITESIKARDHQDQTRAFRPLKPAEDAHLLQLDQEDPEVVFSLVKPYIDTALKDSILLNHGNS